MPTHHACHVCGHDLTRLRAAPDPHYALRLVTCPACATTVARRPDPVVAAYRKGYKAIRACLSILVQCLVATLVTALGLLLIANTAYSAHAEYRHNPLSVLLFHANLLRADAVGPDLLIYLTLLLLLGFFTGLWTRSALAHLNPWGVLVATVLAPLVFQFWSAGLYLFSTRVLDAPKPWGDKDTIARTPEILTTAAMYAAFITAGFPFARPVRNLWRSGQRSRWSRRRRNRRRLRDDR